MPLPRLILVAMSAEEFTRLFKYMEERFDRIDKALENKVEKLDVERILEALDALAKRQEIDEEERLVMRHQLADKIGMQLSA